MYVLKNMLIPVKIISVITISNDILQNICRKSYRKTEPIHVIFPM